MKDTLPNRVRLGTFEVDLRAGELSDGQCTLYLQEQPLSVLRMLVERAGEIVTRDELKRKLWPNNTVVDFDHGINTAIRRLRRAFGDSAEQPKYLATIARRGYRLLVAVEQISASTNGASGSGKAGAASSDNRSSKVDAETASLIGKKVSHYRVLGVIGGGGMGVVYKAEDLKLGRQVALKFLPEELAWDATSLQRFGREAQTASSLNHPNICTIYEVDEHEDRPFIVMELLDGETLRDCLARACEAQKTLPLDQLLDIAIQMASGLEAAHQKSIIHRDIKPANIFLTTSGQVKILDFGLAKLISDTEETENEGLQQVVGGATVALRPVGSRQVDETLTRLGIAMGTAGYMSPEQVRAERLDRRTDIFSFGLVLYEMVTGERAFSGETLEIVHNAIVNRPQIPASDLNPTLPAELVATINKALQKDRQYRYQSAVEMREALCRIRRESERGRFGKRVTESREAHLLRTNALHWANKWTPEGLQKSLRYIQQAIEADPTYAEAYTDLGCLFAALGMSDYATPLDMFPRAQAAAQKALELDDSQAGAHALLAFTRMVFNWDFAGAEYEARRAIELAPRSAPGYYTYSEWCLTQCRFEEAITAARQSLELDALTLIHSYHLGSVYLNARRYADAIGHLKQTLEIDPSFWMGLEILALAYARSGQYEEALAAIDRHASDVRIKAVLGMVKALAGKTDEACSIVRDLMKEQPVSPRMRYRIAGIYAELGEFDNAFECLGKAIDGRSPEIVYLAADPNYDKLHPDPRWQNLLRRVGLVSSCYTADVKYAFGNSAPTL